MPNAKGKLVLGSTKSFENVGRSMVIGFFTLSDRVRIIYLDIYLI